MLATLMRPGDKYVNIPMIVHAEDALPPAVELMDHEDLYA
jgi:hypothetical protein